LVRRNERRVYAEGVGEHGAEGGVRALTLILLTCRIGQVPNNASRWQIGFNSAYKGLKGGSNGTLEKKSHNEELYDMNCSTNIAIFVALQSK
jgi:hypothetical protein